MKIGIMLTNSSNTNIFTQYIEKVLILEDYYQSTLIYIKN
jgi:hypothetical protein